MDYMTRSEKRKQRRLSNIKKIGVIFLVLLCFTIFSYLFVRLGGKLIVDEEYLTLDATRTIETADGTVIGTLYVENRVPVSSHEIPNHVQDAFIAIEDRRFYEHHGLDFKSIVRAIYRDLGAGSKVEGASTITQQLSKNLFLKSETTCVRKIKEMMAALALEHNLSKEDSLQTYCH